MLPEMCQIYNVFITEVKATPPGQNNRNTPENDEVLAEQQEFN